MQLILHELNPQILRLSALLRSIVPDLPIRNLPSQAQRRPLSQSELLAALAGFDECIFTANAVPLSGSHREGAVSIVAIAHPIARICSLHQRHTDRLVQEGEPLESLKSFVDRHLAIAANNLLADFQSSMLSGGSWRRRMEYGTGRDIGRALIDASSACLVDFKLLARSALTLRLADAGIPLPEAVNLRFSIDNDLEERIERVASELEPATFRELIERNQSDLGLFDAVSAAMLDMVPLDEGRRDSILDTLARINDSLVRASGDAFRVKARDNAGQLTYRPDPNLGWWPLPDASATLRVLGRDVVMRTDSNGCRVVPGQPKHAPHTVAVYGCSFVFGWGVADEETFCAHLQRALPDWRVENRGMNGFGTAHNVTQLEQVSMWEPADVVIMGWINPHRWRSVAHPVVIQGFQFPNWMASPISGHPKAFLDEDGELRIRQVSRKRPDLVGIDLTDFEPDEHYMDLVTFRLFKRASEIVGASGGRLAIAAMRSKFSKPLSEMLSEAGIPIIDASLEDRRYTLLPDDGHPNAAANVVFAARILPFIDPAASGVLAAEAAAQ